MTVSCPLCERGELESRVVDETIKYGADSIVVPGVEISVCSRCGEEIVSPSQAKANEVRFADAKRQHDNLLTSDQIVAIRELWGLTQQKAASIFGGGANAFSKYERGEVLQSRPMDILLRAYNEVPQLREFLAGKCQGSWCLEEPSRTIWPTVGRDAYLEWFEELSTTATMVSGWQECKVSNLVAWPQPKARATSVPGNHKAAVLGFGREWGREVGGNSWDGDEGRRYATH